MGLPRASPAPAQPSDSGVSRTGSGEGIPARAKCRAKGVLREPGILGAAGHFRRACESLGTAGGRAVGWAQVWACLASTAAVVWRHLLTLNLTSS